MKVYVSVLGKTLSKIREVSVKNSKELWGILRQHTVEVDNYSGVYRNGKEVGKDVKLKDGDIIVLAPKVRAMTKEEHEELKNKKHKFYGYIMTEDQAEELSDALTEDILERYNSPEYYDSDIIMAFAQDNKLEIAE